MPKDQFLDMLRQRMSKPPRPASPRDVAQAAAGNKPAGRVA
jgi:hypothetical protein